MRKLEDRESPTQKREKAQCRKARFFGFQITSFDIGFQILKYGLMF